MIRNILSTRDYGKFVLSPKNRGINRLHVENIKDSIKKHGNISSITCRKIDGGLYEIIDGQHRFTACKELDITVEANIYNIEEKSMIDLNKDQINWGSSDYLNFGVQCEIPDYIRLSLLKEQFPEYSLTIFIEQLTGGMQKKILNNFKNLLWSIDEERERALRRIIFYTRDYKKIFNIEHYKHKALVTAIGTLCRAGMYDHTRMLQQLGKCSSFFTRQANVDSYYKNIELVYNYKLSSKNKIDIVSGVEKYIIMRQKGKT